MTTFAITNPRSGADLGTYEAATAHAAIGAMMIDAGHSVWTATSVGGDDYDAMTWDSEADAANLSLIHISEPTRPCGTSRMPSSA